MAKQTRSVRVTEAQEDFLDENQLNLSQFVREQLDEELVRQAYGVCAVCGDVLYTNGPTITTCSASTPIGQEIGLDDGEGVDFCHIHEELLYDDEETVSLDYINKVYDGDVKAYMLEVRAIMDAQPDCSYTVLVTDREIKPDGTHYLYYKRLIFHAIKDWLDDESANRNKATDEFDSQAVFEETEVFPQEFWASVTAK